MKPLDKEQIARMTPDQVADLLATPEGADEVERALTGRTRVDTSRLSDPAYLATLSQDDVARNWAAIAAASKKEA